MRREYDRRREEFSKSFGRAGWKLELEGFYRQRKSVAFVLAAMIAMSAFWDNPWTWVVYFGVMAVYSILAGVRIGAICGVSFCIWFIEGIEARHLPHWMWPGHAFYQTVGLWCIATLFLLVVWKADGVETIRKGERLDGSG